MFGVEDFIRDFTLVPQTHLPPPRTKQLSPVSTTRDQSVWCARS
jgi:hypothetical protein